MAGSGGASLLMRFHPLAGYHLGLGDLVGGHTANDPTRTSPWTKGRLRANIQTGLIGWVDQQLERET